MYKPKKFVRIEDLKKIVGVEVAERILEQMGYAKSAGARLKPLSAHQLEAGLELLADEPSGKRAAAAMPAVRAYFAYKTVARLAFVRWARTMLAAMQDGKVPDGGYDTREADLGRAFVARAVKTAKHQARRAGRVFTDEDRATVIAAAKEEVLSGK
jgi:hypothetical protein